MTNPEKESMLRNVAGLCRCWDMECDDLTPAEQVFKVLWELQEEMREGGFDEYFSNPAGSDAARAETFLRRIGAFDLAQIVADAIRQWPGGHVPHNADERLEMMEDLPDSAFDQWDELDAHFNAERDRLMGCLYDYLQAHEEQVAGFERAHHPGDKTHLSKPSFWDQLFGRGGDSEKG